MPLPYSRARPGVWGQHGGQDARSEGLKGRGAGREGRGEMRQEVESYCTDLAPTEKIKGHIVGFRIEKWHDLTCFSRAALAAKTTLGQRQTPPLESPVRGLLRVSGETWPTAEAGGMGSSCLLLDRFCR